MISELLRKLAEQLRKQAGLQKTPGVIPNPVASRATGAMGSLAPATPPDVPQAAPTTGGKK